MNKKSIKNKLQGELFLSSMMGETDGEFCARCGQGASLLQLGAYIASRENQLKEEKKKNPQYFLPFDFRKMKEFFREELQPIQKSNKNWITALNLGVLDIKTGIKAGKAWQEAGGDLLELNIHGNWQDLKEEGYLVGMAYSQYRERLQKWTKKLVKEEVPLLLKFRANIEVDFTEILEMLADTEIYGYHFNIKDENHNPDFNFIREISSNLKENEILLVSGSIRTPSQISKLFSLGVDSVGFARPVLNDKKYIKKMKEKLNQ